ncbi:TetR/AcrR family transcriptional regulator [Microlunatus soli]|uniref:DNA-binding transcriptional regulator, AcrR family n=1 Tax=Microlunatus soli TaxID=630515 RepID=A0A1H1PNF5_9ACTN|nr:TetR/AcrR family transcriptional regulator [Microlunatus soli]SDS12811.1 DNA-binding transcriptional regulator, AcrR family [Microlunatus soli]
MAVARTPRQKWVDEGLRVLAVGGPDAVRVEVLAKALGVTKGGFYGYFADRSALLEAMLDTWERESVDDVLTQVENEDGAPVEVAQRARRLTFSEDRLLPIDLAIRDWARRDEAVATRLARVDNRRIALLRTVIGSFCDDPVEVEARSMLAFCAAIGSQFIHVDHGELAVQEVFARAAELLLTPPAH